MGERVRYPRALAAVRFGIYAAAGVLAVVFGGVTLATLVALLAMSGLALVLHGTVNVVAIAGVAGIALVVLGLLVGGLAVGARRVDRALREAARRPDPVERLKQRYVNADVDEAEFESRLERLLGETAASTQRSSAADAGTDDVGGGESETDGPVRVWLR